MENPTLLYSSSPDGALATRRRASPIAHPLCTGMTNLKNREKRRVQTPLEGKDERRRRRRSLARQEELQFLLPPQDPLNPTPQKNLKNKQTYTLRPRNATARARNTPRPPRRSPPQAHLHCHHLHGYTQFNQTPTTHNQTHVPLPTHYKSRPLQHSRREISRNHYSSYFSSQHHLRDKAQMCSRTLCASSRPRMGLQLEVEATSVGSRRSTKAWGCDVNPTLEGGGLETPTVQVSDS